jgi:hypothetical protein
MDHLGSNSMTNGSARLQLERVFKDFKNLPFPPSGKDKELQDVHGVLILYDADVAAAVSKILQTPITSSDPGRLTGLREDRTLEAMIDKLVRKYPNGHEIGSVARQYANYYDMIKKVLRAAHSYLGSQGNRSL